MKIKSNMAPLIASVQLAAVLGVSVTTAPAQSFLTNGLVAYYPLNANARDVSGNAINGTVVGAVAATDRFGTVNRCYSFNGNGQYIYAPADKLPSGQRTISLWFRANNLNTYPVLLGYGAGCGSAFLMGLNIGGAGSFQSSTHCSGYGMVVAYASPPTNVWDHWVVTIDAVRTVFYLNGTSIGSQPVTLTTAVAGAQLGLGVAVSVGGGVPYADGNVGYLNGYLDDVRIYNLALSASQVQQLYALESATGASQFLAASH